MGARPEKRCEDRQECDAVVEWAYFNKADFFNARLLNFSGGGSYIECTQPLIPGATILIRLQACAASGGPPPSATCGPRHWARSNGAGSCPRNRPTDSESASGTTSRCEMNPKQPFLKIAWNLFLIAAGSILCAVAINGILIPNQFLAGGISGLSLFIHYLFPAMPVGALNFLLNIPLFVVGWLFVGRRFFY